MIERIISGGQTGADQAGLFAAKELGLVTGGWMPRGYKTQSGPDPNLARMFNLSEHESPAYPPRTEANVSAADATLIFGDASSPGCRLTRRLCREHNKPIFIQEWRSGWRFSSIDLERFRIWISKNSPRVLNVAGNREEKQPGIYRACHEFLISALTPAGP